jgi:hypothetical protein
MDIAKGTNGVRTAFVFGIARIVTLDDGLTL